MPPKIPKHIADLLAATPRVTDKQIENMERLGAEADRDAAERADLQKARFVNAILNASREVDGKAAMYDLMGVRCACSAVKDRRRTFCLACFRRLPRGLRAKLAGVGVHRSEYLPAGYPEIYAEALKALGLESPFLKGAK